MTEQPEMPHVNIVMPQEMVGGVWSNFAQVSHSPFEFTIDFCRLNYGEQSPNGVAVARVNLSPLMVAQLMEALQSNWESYAAKSMPREVRGDGEEG